MSNLISLCSMNVKSLSSYNFNGIIHFEISHLHRDDCKNRTNHDILKNAMFTIVYKFSSHSPWLHTTQWKYMFDGRLIFQSRL